MALPSTPTDFPNNALSGVVTYWAPAGTNRYGQPTWANGVLLRSRWEDKAVQVRRNTGEEFTSQAIVWLETDVELQGLLAQGNHEGLPPSVDAKEIQQTQTIPDLRNLGKERRAYL